jgi:hypothetical protein
MEPPFGGMQTFSANDVPLCSLMYEHKDHALQPHCPLFCHVLSEAPLKNKEAFVSKKPYLP